MGVSATEVKLWREKSGASIAATAVQFNVSEETVKQCCEGSSQVSNDPVKLPVHSRWRAVSHEDAVEINSNLIAEQAASIAGDEDALATILEVSGELDRRIMRRLEAEEDAAKAEAKAIKAEERAVSRIAKAEQRARAKTYIAGSQF